MPDNLEEIHIAIVDGLKAALPSAVSVEAYPDLERKIRLPAVLVELAELEPCDNPGTGETPLLGRFQARAIVDPAVSLSELQVRELAARITVALQDQCWGADVSVASFVSAGEDAFKPELDGYRVWMVEWTHQFCLGQASWPYPASGSEIMLGLDPQTGPPHVDDYWPLGSEPPVDWGEA